MNYIKFNLLNQFFPNLSTIDRYLILEITPVFLFSLGIISSLGVAIGTLSDLGNRVLEHGLPLQSAGIIFFLKLPEYTSYGLPISILLAILISYSRLSKDGEIIALRSAGISIYRIILPGIVLSLIVTGISFLFNELILPAANHQATTILVEAIPEEKPFFVKKDVIYREFEEVISPNGKLIPKIKTLFFAREFHNNQMEDLTILTWSQGKLHRIIISSAASWNNLSNAWDFFDGTIYNIAPNTSLKNTLTFQNKQLKFSRAPLDLVQKNYDPDSMNISQIRNYLEIIKHSGDDKSILKFQVRLQQKMAFPFICLIFGIVGSALGIRPQYISRSSNFAITVGIVFSYYLIGFLIGSLGLIGIISPFLAGWLPNFLGLGISFLILYCTIK